MKYDVTLFGLHTAIAGRYVNVFEFLSFHWVSGTIPRTSDTKMSNFNFNRVHKLMLCEGDYLRCQ